MSVKLGEAIVYLMGDKQPLQKDLKAAEKETEHWASGLAGKVSKLVGTAIKVGVGAVAAGVVALGTAAFASANSIDNAYDIIITATGATGEALSGLQADYRSVFRDFAGDGEMLAGVMAELNTRTGLTGDALQSLSRPLAETVRLMGGDGVQRTQLFSRALGDWSLSVEDGEATLDKFFRASQLTGIGMDQLMGKVVQFGAPMRLMGFSLDDAIALFGKWEQEGVNAELVMGSLRIAAGKFAAEGKPLRESLLATFESIKNNTDASQALSDAMAIFGARAGPDMAAAIREGRFEFDELLVALSDSEGAIMNTAAATEDWGEKLTRLKHRAAVALEPLGAVLMDLASRGVDRLIPMFDRLAGVIERYVVPAIDRFVGFIDEAIELIEWTIEGGGSLELVLRNLFSLLLERLGLSEDAIDDLFGKINAAQDVLQTVIAWIQSNLEPILAGLAAVILTVVIPAFISWAAATATAAAATAAALAPVLIPILAIGAAVALLYKAWTENWGGIQEKTQAAIQFVRDLIITVLLRIQEFWSQHGDAITAKARDVWTSIPAGIQAALDTIRRVIVQVMGFVREFWATNGETLMAVARNTWDTVLAIVEFVINTIKNIVAAVLAAIRGDWTGFGQALRRIVDDLFRTLLRVFTNQLNSLWRLVRQAITNIKTVWTSVDWGSLGGAIIEGIKNGISNGLDAIKDAARNAARAALDAAKGFLGISSPSRVAAKQIGMPFIQGVGQGIDEAMARLARTQLPEVAARLVDVPAREIARTSLVAAPQQAAQNTWQITIQSYGPLNAEQLAGDLALIGALRG